MRCDLRCAPSLRVRPDAPAPTAVPGSSSCRKCRRTAARTGSLTRVPIRSVTTESIEAQLSRTPPRPVERHSEFLMSRWVSGSAVRQGSTGEARAAPPDIRLRLRRPPFRQRVARGHTRTEVGIPVMPLRFVHQPSVRCILRHWRQWHHCDLLRRTCRGLLRWSSQSSANAATGSAATGTAAISPTAVAPPADQGSAPRRTPARSGPSCN